MFASPPLGMQALCVIYPIGAVQGHDAILFAELYVKLHLCVLVSFFATIPTYDGSTICHASLVAHLRVLRGLLRMSVKCETWLRTGASIHLVFASDTRDHMPLVVRDAHTLQRMVPVDIATHAWDFGQVSAPCASAIVKFDFLRWVDECIFEQHHANAKHESDAMTDMHWRAFVNNFH